MRRLRIAIQSRECRLCAHFDSMPGSNARSIIARAEAKSKAIRRSSGIEEDASAQKDTSDGILIFASLAYGG